MTPVEVLDKGSQIKAALAASDDAPPEAVMLAEMLLGMALNLATLAHPTGESS